MVFDVFKILQFLTRDSFWEAFSSNLLAGLVVAFLVALWINRTTDLFKRPKLTLVVKQNGHYREKILLSNRLDGDFEASFYFAIRNDGNQVLRPFQGYWHTYIHETEGRNQFSVSGEDNHQRGIISDAVYPSSYTDFGTEWKFKIPKDKLNSVDVPYFFATDYGYFPSSVKMDQGTGQIPYSTMGKVGYELPLQ
ncbi:MAG: hypothetical protein KBC33_00540 [Candidatus Pacebacteria bacterium]|nr:hypothetical protein [Candidatus Paceibacterota bacterium]